MNYARGGKCHLGLMASAGVGIVGLVRAGVRWYGSVHGMLTCVAT